jgi:hypothetical protein
VLDGGRQLPLPLQKTACRAGDAALSRSGRKHTRHLKEPERGSERRTLLPPVEYLVGKRGGFNALCHRSIPHEGRVHDEGYRLG